MPGSKVIKFTKPLRVLVVEDNVVDRKILETMLTESSKITSFLKVAGTLTEAIRYLEKYRFDVVLLDLNLPDSDGEVTLKKVSSRFPDVSIVVNTGAYEDQIGLRTLSSGAQDFLIKGKYTAYVLNKVLHFALERKRLELELKTAYKNLKETQSQLVQAEKMKVVGGLASGVAHEVKNPLATILYGLTYLSEQLKDKGSKVDTVLRNMSEAASKANSIITDLLNFSSLTRLHKKRENLNDLIEKSLSLINHEFEKNHISLVRKLQRNLPEIKIDKNRIEQVLLNLFLNSVYAMTEGGRLMLKTYVKKLPRNFQETYRLSHNGFKAGQSVVILEVEDEGCGIPGDKIDQIFDPFFTTRRSNGGVGLGLSVSKNIMDIHEGDIRVENRKDGGALARVIFKV